jgi:hypothetical protein
VATNEPKAAASSGAPASKPVAHPPGSSIVGGCREPEISELAPQVDRGEQEAAGQVGIA